LSAFGGQVVICFAEPSFCSILLVFNKFIMKYLLATVAWTKGRKSYIISILMIAVGLVNLISGDITVIEWINDPYFLYILGGGGVASLRHAIK